MLCWRIKYDDDDVMIRYSLVLSTSADLRQGGADAESVSGVWIRTADPYDFQNLTLTSLSKDTSVIKLS